MISVKAGILSYVLAIGLLVSVGLSMLSLYVYYSLNVYTTYKQGISLLENLRYARNIAVGAWDQFDDGVDYTYDLFGEGTDSVMIHKERWGLLDLFSVTAFHRSRSKKSVFLLANTPAKEARSAVYLLDEGRPLSVVGDTKLTGDCYLPTAGVQSAYINRVGYKNEELVYGEELKSEKKLPEVELDEAFEKLAKLAGTRIEVSRDTITNSFLDSLIELSGTSLNLNGSYSGKLFIKASGRLVFDSLSQAEDIIAFAPVIEFNKGFEGNGQFFASDTIIVHDSVRLTYPTVIAVYNEDEPAQIHLSQSSDVSGWMLIDGEDGGFRRRVIHLESGSKFTGMLYCDGLLETYGSISGNVTVKRFLVNAPSAVYENYLLNAKIDATQLDSAFLMPPEWFFTSSARILKYLD